MVKEYSCCFLGKRCVYKTDDNFVFKKLKFLKDFDFWRKIEKSGKSGNVVEKSQNVKSQNVKIVFLVQAKLFFFLKQLWEWLMCLLESCLQLICSNNESRTARVMFWLGMFWLGVVNWKFWILDHPKNVAVYGQNITRAVLIDVSQNVEAFEQLQHLSKLPNTYLPSTWS